jgi:hypothetical protein
MAKLMGMSFGGLMPRNMETAATRAQLPRRHASTCAWVEWCVCMIEMAIPFCGLLSKDCVLW